MSATFPPAAQICRASTSPSPRDPPVMRTTLSRKEKRCVRITRAIAHAPKRRAPASSKTRTFISATYSPARETSQQAAAKDKFAATNPPCGGLPWNVAVPCTTSGCASTSWHLMLDAGATTRSLAPGKRLARFLDQTAGGGIDAIADVALHGGAVNVERGQPV